MSFVVSTLFVFTVVAALLTNRDLLSPAKFYLFSFFVFHVGAVGTSHATEVWLLILLVVLVGAIAVLFEALNVRRARTLLTAAPETVSFRMGLPAEPAHVFVFLWLLSLPALLAQIYVVELFGGLEGYVGILANRVIEWRGMGVSRTLIGTLATLDLVYLALGLTRPRSPAWWTVYAFHFFCVLVIGLLSGSRSGILNVLGLQVFIYHYIRRPVKLRMVVLMAAALVCAGLVLGVVREGFRIDDGEFSMGLSDAEQVLSVPTLNYGVTPLEILADAASLKLAYGSTLVSLLTNAVPRDWWPEKPDTGGVFFTKQYTGDEWDGASNLTPTLLGEFVVNFGWVAGTVTYLIAYPLLMYAVVRQYRRTRSRLRRCRDGVAAIDLVVYLLWMWSVVALMTGEVTNVLLTFMLTGLIPAVLARGLIARLMHRRTLRRVSGPRSAEIGLSRAAGYRKTLSDLR